MTTNNNDGPSRTELLRDLPHGRFVTVRKIDQGGALQARRLSGGAIQFYWRYTHQEKTDRVAIGSYDPSASYRSLTPTARGFSITAAAEACRAKALIQRQNEALGGYREHVAAQKRAHDESKATQKRAAEQTVAKLVDTYCDYLQDMGRRSHADARSIFKLHLSDKWPAVAAAPATDLSAEQVTDMLRKLVEEGKGRTANKLRSYLRAAYQCALDVNSLASIPGAFKVFQVKSNPAALTKRSSAYDRADKNPLTTTELQQYWSAIKGVPGIAGTALRLHLLTGGQRVEQFVKLKRTDVAPESITIFDAKGRPGLEPRRHTVPLVAKAQVDAGNLSSTGEFALSTDGGKSHLSAMTLSGWAKTAATEIPDFQLKRVRSGVETALAAAGISKEVRGHLQSHGLAGVQARHYDAYDYAREKREALDRLLLLLDPQSASPKRKSARKQ